MGILLQTGKAVPALAFAWAYTVSRARTHADRHMWVGALCNAPISLQIIKRGCYTGSNISDSPNRDSVRGFLHHGIVSNSLMQTCVENDIDKWFSFFKPVPAAQKHERILRFHFTFSTGRQAVFFNLFFIIIHFSSAVMLLMSRMHLGIVLLESPRRGDYSHAAICSKTCNFHD